MTNTRRYRIIATIAFTVIALGIGTTAFVAADDSDDPAIPVEPDGGIGDTPIPVEPDGGIGDTPIPVEPDGGIGDSSGDQFPVEEARAEAHGLLGRFEQDLSADVRTARRGAESFALTEDYVLGRFTVELDAEGGAYRVVTVTVELPHGPETFHLTPG